MPVSHSVLNVKMLSMIVKLYIIFAKVRLEL